MIHNIFYLGDEGYKDGDGYLKFVGRDDDIMNPSGYRVGPEEIEIPIESHECIKNAIAIGKPDKIRGEIVKVFCTLTDKGKSMNKDKLFNELVTIIGDKVGWYAKPRDIGFEDELEVTTSGKKKRYVYREREKMDIK